MKIIPLSQRNTRLSWIWWPHYFSLVSLRHLDEDSKSGPEVNPAGRMNSLPCICFWSCRTNCWLVWLTIQWSVWASPVSQTALAVPDSLSPDKWTEGLMSVIVICSYPPRSLMTSDPQASPVHSDLHGAVPMWNPPHPSHRVTPLRIFYLENEI